MHLEVPGAIGNFYYIQEDLTKAGYGTRAYLSKAFHQDISQGQGLCADSLARPQFLAEVVQHLPTALVFCDASGTSAVWGLDRPQWHGCKIRLECAVAIGYCFRSG